MTSKGKKKKQQTLSLGQFHAMPPSGSSSAGDSAPSQQSSAAPSANIIRMNWADEMEKVLEDGTGTPPTDFMFDRSKLPTAPRSTLQPDIDMELVPKKPPFRAYLSNISFEADEEKLRGFFKDCKVDVVHLATDAGGRFKGTGYVDFEDRDSLITALGKNETSISNRPLKIMLTEMQRGGYGTGRMGDRDRGGGFRQQTGGADQPGSDEACWRRTEPEPEPVSSYGSSQYGSSRYSTAGGGRYQSDRGRGGDNYQSRGGGDRDQYQSRGGDRDQYQSRGGDRDQYQPRGGDRDQYQSRYQGGGGGGSGGRSGGYGNGAGGGYERKGGYEDKPRRTYGYGQNKEQHSPPVSESGSSAAAAPASDAVARPKIMLIPRSIPVEEANAAGGTASSIFGSARPVNTAAREREIEERLKEKEKADKEKLADESSNTSINQDEPDDKQRSHKTSTASEDNLKPDPPQPSEKRTSESSEPSGKPKPFYNSKQDNNNNTTSNNNNARQQTRMPQSTSFTSPSNSSGQQRPQESKSKTAEMIEAPKPTENAWKTRTAAELFAKEQSEQSADTGRSANSTNSYGGGGQRHHNDENQANRRPYTKRPDAPQQNRPPPNRDNKERRGGGVGGSGDRNKPPGRNPRNDRQFGANTRTDRQQYGSNFDGFNSSSDQHDSQSNDLGFNNKFANLKVDVDEAEEDF